MKYFLFGILIIASLTSAAQDNTSIALKFHHYLVAEKFDSAYGCFDKVVTDKITLQQLGDTWHKVQEQVGKFQGLNGTSSENNGSIVYLTCRFEKVTLDMKVVFNNKQLIQGFFFVQPKPKEKYKLPAYADSSLYTEKEITITSGKYKLPGTLSIPKGIKNFPILILIHGSGPNDRDETIGPNKPFKDLAAGLASKGIAVLRFDKRTYIYGNESSEDPNHLTVKDEVLDDALAAIDFAKKVDGVDAGHIYLLGHSLGATLAPRIATLTKSLKGIILMSGYSRPLEDVVIEQYNYLYGLDGLTDEKKAELKKMTDEAALIRENRINDSTPKNQLLLGLPASYWLDLNKYSPGDALKHLSLRVLVLQGERDYQVTMEDFTLFQEAANGKKNITFKSYPRLNHLYQEGENKSVPGEYDHQLNIPDYVVTDIANWIKGD